MEVVVWLGHEELLSVVQENMAAQLERLVTPAAIRAHFSIANDLNADEESAAVTVPLLSPGAPALADDVAPPP
eukprot:5740627-Prymnesium_polylepis.1